MKTERELFEEAFKKVNSGVSFWLNTWSDQDDDYGHLTASWGWHMWQASANREGYKLVPIKCTNNMAHAAKEVDGRLSAFKYGDVWEAMIGACDDH